MQGYLSPSPNEEEEKEGIVVVRVPSPTSLSGTRSLGGHWIKVLERFGDWIWRTVWSSSYPLSIILLSVVMVPSSSWECEPRILGGVIKEEEEVESWINWIQLDPVGTAELESKTRSQSCIGFEPVDENKDRIGGWSTFENNMVVERACCVTNLWLSFSKWSASSWKRRNSIYLKSEMWLIRSTRIRMRGWPSTTTIIICTGSRIQVIILDLLRWDRAKVRVMMVVIIYVIYIKRVIGNLQK